MNYLHDGAQRRRDDPHADQSGVDRKVGDGGWRIHGKHVVGLGDDEKFTLDAGEVCSRRGRSNSTEILLRSEAHGLSVFTSARHKFNATAISSARVQRDSETDVLGYLPTNRRRPANRPAPGRIIVGLLRYSTGCRRATASPSRTSLPARYVDAAKPPLA